jgi:3-oxoacyl-[acyl-carrier-protein] synthase II
LIRAAQMIRDGDAARVLVVAGDASIIPLLIGAFAHMGVLSAEACRPFDRDRSGFFVSEGAAAVTIEATDDAAFAPPISEPGRPRPRSFGHRHSALRNPQSRHALPGAPPVPPIAELAGWVTGADPTGLTAQDATGSTLARAISILLERSSLSASEVSLYSAHGTATASNDQAESAAIHAVFAQSTDSPFSRRTEGPRALDPLTIAGPRVFAAKSVVGHLLGAAGLTEAVLAIQAIRHGVVPPIATLRAQDPRCDIRVSAVAEAAGLPVAICTSLGFGGQFGLLAFRRT